MYAPPLGKFAFLSHNKSALLSFPYFPKISKRCSLVTFLVRLSTKSVVDSGDFERERDTERDRERERDTERDLDRERDADLGERERETEELRDREREREGDLDRLELIAMEMTTNDAKGKEKASTSVSNFVPLKPENSRKFLGRNTAFAV